MRDQEPTQLWPALDVANKQRRLRESIHFFTASIANVIDTHRAHAEDAHTALWRRDPSAWSADRQAKERVAARLGWMSSPALMADAIPTLQAFAADVRRNGLTHVVLLGMGGSSLAPEVLRAVLGVAPGFPQFYVLDSTDPVLVRAAETPPELTLYVIASKSGTTVEPNALAAHFKARLEARVPDWASHFVAITDEGTDLATRAHRDGFRRLFINPSDIGGRYSALSFFGLVPAALMGQDLNALVGWGLAMVGSSEPSLTEQHESMTLGLSIGAAARAGRDKLTLLLPAGLAPLGLWVEQLIAESTGKNGTGIVPIAGEDLRSPAEYGSDRSFYRLTASEAQTDELAQFLGDLRAAGAPVIESRLPEPSALGAEFVRWEIATAVAGAVLQVNPFDEPNVQQSKDATRTLLDVFAASGRLPVPPGQDRLPSGVTLSMTSRAREQLGNQAAESFLTLLRPGDYFALLAYLPPTDEISAALMTFRRAVGEQAGVATMLGYGPRYLHSTGQLYKGGGNTGVFILVSADPIADVAIPGEPFSFGTLELAQALGDMTSLDGGSRRALHLHLSRPEPASLRDVCARLLRHVPAPAHD
jgi:glucose-6-phosphate isomerase